MLHRIKADTRVIVPDLVRHAKSMWSMAQVFRVSILGCCLQMSGLGLRRRLSGYEHLLYRLEGMCLHKNLGLVVLDICMDRDRGIACWGLLVASLALDSVKDTVWGNKAEIIAQEAQNFLVSECVHMGITTQYTRHTYMYRQKCQ